MNQIVGITSQGQLTIPKKMLNSLGINGKVKALVTEVDGKLIVEPKDDFWSLGGSLKGDITLSDQELQKARKSFENDWSDEK